MLTIQCTLLRLQLQRLYSLLYVIETRWSYVYSFDALESGCLLWLQRNRPYLSHYFNDCAFFVGNQSTDRVRYALAAAWSIVNVPMTNDDVCRWTVDFIGQVNNQLRYLQNVDCLVARNLFDYFYNF
jgi:hypothetical protein